MDDQTQKEIKTITHEAWVRLENNRRFATDEHRHWLDEYDAGFVSVEDAKAWRDKVLKAYPDQDDLVHLQITLPPHEAARIRRMARVNGLLLKNLVLSHLPQGD